MALDSPRLFDHDELTGITEYYYYDDDTGGFIMESVQDVEDVIEDNKARANMAPSHWRGNWHRVASIPNVVMMELSKQGIVSPAGRIFDQQAFRKWLNDRDNQLFRTRPGKV